VAFHSGHPPMGKDMQMSNLSGARFG
jgi:hypothetical protein